MIGEIHVILNVQYPSSHLHISDVRLLIKRQIKYMQVEFLYLFIYFAGIRDFPICRFDGSNHDNIHCDDNILQICENTRGRKF